jgi:hypothetical protein
VGIRLSGFAPQLGFAYTFSIVQDEDGDEGTWYRYEVQEDATSARYSVGALRFDRGARIRPKGGSWLEVFSRLHSRRPRSDSCQHYEDIPRVRFGVTPTGDRHSPIRADVTYGNNSELIPQQSIDFVRRDAHFEFSIGPSVVRTTERGNVELVPRYLAQPQGEPIRP